VGARPSRWPPQAAPSASYSTPPRPWILFVTSPGRHCYLVVDCSQLNMVTTSFSLHRPLPGVAHGEGETPSVKQDGKTIKLQNSQIVELCFSLLNM
jgi:hypothetical protein